MRCQRITVTGMSWIQPSSSVAMVRFDTTIRLSVKPLDQDSLVVVQRSAYSRKPMSTLAVCIYGYQVISSGAHQTGKRKSSGSGQPRGILNYGSTFTLAWKISLVPRIPLRMAPRQILGSICRSHVSNGLVSSGTSLPTLLGCPMARFRCGRMGPKPFFETMFSGVGPRIPQPGTTS